MNLLPIHLLFGVGLVSCVYSNAIPAGGDEGNLCPPPDSIAPCTCFKSPYGRITARCAEFKNAYDIIAIFDRNPSWKVQDLWIENSVMSVIPAVMLEKSYFERLHINSTTLVRLFDRTPVQTPEHFLYLTDVRIQRGFEWSSIAAINLMNLKIVNMTMRSLGEEFKDNVPKMIKGIWLENTGITKIKSGAFSDLSNLDILVLKRGNLKKVSRDMFPNPSVMYYLDLSYQKIADLPEDFFVDMPGFSYFHFEGNLLTTISEKTFTIHGAIYLLEDNPIVCNCDIKWITEKLAPHQLNGECAEPESLKGTKLSSLRTSNFGYCH